MTGMLTKDEQKMQEARAAIIKAGKDMGEYGDHWPLIQSVLRDISKDYDEYQAERAIFEIIVGEVRHTLADLEDMLKTANDHDKPLIKETHQKISALLQQQLADFSLLDDMDFNDMPMPKHIAHADNILRFKGDNDGDV
jgi:hypothetical protein